MFSKNRLFKKNSLPSLFFNLLPCPLEIAFREFYWDDLLAIDLKFTKQLNLSSIFSIFSKFSMKIVGGDNVTHLVTKIPVSLLVLDMC